MFTLKSRPTDDPARHKAPGSGAVIRWQKSNYPLNHCFLRHQYVLRIVLFQRSIQPDPRKKKSNPIRAQNSATVVSENAITSQCSPSSPPTSLLVTLAHPGETAHIDSCSSITQATVGIQNCRGLVVGLGRWLLANRRRWLSAAASVI